MVLMLAPLTPHVAEELWERLGEPGSLAFADFPEPDPALLVDETVEVPVQVNGKVRATVTVATGASEAEHEAAARADAQVAELLAGVDGAQGRRRARSHDQLRRRLTAPVGPSTPHGRPVRSPSPLPALPPRSTAPGARSGGQSAWCSTRISRPARNASSGTRSSRRPVPRGAATDDDPAS